MKKRITLIVISIIIAIALKFVYNSRNTKPVFFAPKNKFYLPVSGNKMATGINEETFNKVIDDFTTIYTPIVKEAGAKLKINKKWKDGTVNSDTSHSGSTWVINSYGGLARFRGMNYDGFMAVLCHEISHSLGGFPKYKDQTWASTEGESDYGAMLKCFHNIYAEADNISAITNLNIPSVVSEKCALGHYTEQDIALCKRSAMAGFLVAQVLHDLGEEKNPISFETPDTTVVTTTNEDHPLSQCRLDTYLAGAVCNANYRIPISDTNGNDGACSEVNGNKFGLRPRCWYAP